jgi:MFS family permease
MSSEEPLPFDDHSYAIFRYRPVMYLWLARIATALAYQMQAVAVGWQIYELTSSPLHLGFVGLMMFIPAVLLVLVVGPIVDRFNRKIIISLAQLTMAAAVAFLAFTTVSGLITTSLILGTVFALGAARSFEATAMQTLPPSIVPPAVLPQTIGGLSSAYQVATIVGPGIGGLLLILGPTYVYVTCCALFVASSGFIWMITMRRAAPKREPFTLGSLFAGISFVSQNPIVLGAMSLDLFAVIFAGATALFPIYARDIFEVGPTGLGLMRSAPAIGAILVSLIIVRWPLRYDVGRTMYIGVAMYGFATIVFGISTSYPLALAALAITGGADMLSVVIRQPLIQLETPDAMRGRVSAVNSLFIGTSNQIGEFRAGLAAHYFGTVPSVLIGGVGTLLIVLIWIKAFPALYHVHTFEKRYRK